MSVAAAAKVLAYLTIVGGLGGCLGDAGPSEPSDAATGPGGSTGDPPGWTGPGDDPNPTDGDPGLGPDDSTPVEPVPEVVQFGCTTHFGIFPVPTDEAAAFLPAGFDTMTQTHSTLSQFVTKTWSCAETTIDGTPLGPTGTSVYYLPVEPPAEHADPAIASYFVLIGLLSNHAELAQRFASWNLTGARLGNVSLYDESLDAASIGEVSALEEGFGYVQETQAGSKASSDPFRARYFGVAEGAVTNYVEIPVTASEVRSAGPAHLRFGLGSGPFTPKVLAGTGYHQYWAEDDLSYEWFNVPAPVA